MKKILITGANSYIGDSVRDYLLQEPDRYSVSIKDTVGWNPTPNDFKGYDVVFNVAGIAHIKETKKNRPLYYAVNRDLAISIAQAAKEAGVKQFILLSSMSVYGMTTGHITKKTKPNPTTAYGRSKLQADRAIDSIAKDSNGEFLFACLRPPMVYGKGCKGNYQMLRKFAIKSPIFPDYNNQRSMIYVGNLCEFVKQVIEGNKTGLFFPQNSSYVTTSNMVKLVAEEHNKRIQFLRVFNTAIRLSRINIVSKVFGDLTYEQSDIIDKFGFADSIKMTEGLKKNNSGKMKILATCQYGWPEPYPSLYPMEEMAKRGHYVHAITGTPNYPMGEVFKGYEHNRIKEEDHNGIHITHVPVVPRKHDAIHRLLNYHSYPITAKRKLMSIKDEYDVIFANQSSPVMMVEPAIEYGKKHHKKVVMYCMDLWPASLCIGGVKRNSVLYRYYWKRSKAVYQNVDVLMVTSKSFKDYFISEFNIPEERIVYLPQYALSDFENMPETHEKDTTDFVFAGNVGKAQNLEVVLGAAKMIQDEGYDDHGKKILFHIVGNGQALDSLQNYAKEHKIENVVFHGRKPPEEMPKYYAMADAMIVTMLPDQFVSLTLPAKVQSYMAAGKPIIASADGEVSNVIRDARCGYCAKADDEMELVNAFKRFINTQHRSCMGDAGKEYYDLHFSKERIIDALEKILFKQL